MIYFELIDIKASGAATVTPSGDTLQTCVVAVLLMGVNIQDQRFFNTVDFIVPNSIMQGAAMPTVAAWNYIQQTLAPNWVAENYTAI